MTRVADRAVSVQTDGVRSPVATARLSVLACKVLGALRIPRAMISITLVNRHTMARLNRQHLGHRGATDVITFTLEAPQGGGILADIYICPEVARANAMQQRVGVREELARLVVHGTLHACGFDHPEDEERMSSPMWRRQEQLVHRFWISPTRGA